MTDPHMAPIKIFCSYAPEDKEWFEKLEKHLGPLKHQGLISTRHNQDTLPGVDYVKSINTHLENASIILLLISPNFLASDYYYSSVMQKALERHKNNQAVVIPIFLKPVHWQGSPFEHLRGLPINTKPISLWNDVDEAFSYIVKGIHDVISEVISEVIKIKNTQYRKPDENGALVTLHQPPYSSPREIFPFNERLIDPNEFYGRTREYRQLLEGIRKKATISIVGPRRIGKTWLMNYVKLVKQKDLGTRYIVGYIDVTTPQCATVTGFTMSALEALGIQKYLSNDIDNPLSLLQDAVKAFYLENKIPVLCIDEFEGFAHRPTFDNLFFTNLRAIANLGLCLITASKIPVIEVVNQHTKTSPFFNIIAQLRLDPFRPKDVELFIQSKGDKAGLNTQERQYLSKYGQKDGSYWPVRLQLAGKLLLEDKTDAWQEQDQDYYRLEDPNYWDEFEARLEEQWRAIAL